MNTSLNQTTYTYTSFLRRGAAFFIDALIMSLVLVPLVLLLLDIDFDNFDPQDYAQQQLRIQAISGLLYYLYFALWESSKYRATPGKMALGVKVCDADGAQLNFWQALGRNICKMLSAGILFIGFLMPLWTKKRQTLHDIITSCIVLDTTK